MGRKETSLAFANIYIALDSKEYAKISDMLSYLNSELDRLYTLESEIFKPRMERLG